MGMGMSAQLDFLNPPPDPAPPAPKSDRKRKARELQESGARRWIQAGKPIALEVARAWGFVTAASFRAAAEKLNALPPSYGNQRALSWIPSMFWQLCRDGELRKRRRGDGSIVKIYSDEQGNEQTVYELNQGSR